MNDERFFDLAMKAIARQCTDAERAELDALLARQPGLKAEFERLQAEVRVAREALPLVEATGATAGELPGYARGRLQTKVRQTLGRPPAAETTPGDRERAAMLRWRWVLGLAAVTATVVLLVMPVFRGAPQSIIQLAMLDMGGPSRGSETNEVAVLKQTWQGAAVAEFSDAETLRAWELNWPGRKGQTVAKVVYDRAAAEIRVHGKTGKGTFARTFPVVPDLASALAQARLFIAEQARQ
jgi:hypothetical protein